MAKKQFILHARVGDPPTWLTCCFDYFSRERRAKGSRFLRLQPGPGRSPRRNPTYRFLLNFYRIVIDLLSNGRHPTTFPWTLALVLASLAGQLAGQLTFPFTILSRGGTPLGGITILALQSLWREPL